MEAELPVPVVRPQPQSERLFALFLKDHLAVLHGACCMARRALRSNRRQPVGRILSPLHVALQEDLMHLGRIAHAHGVRPSRWKNLAAGAAERVGRLKLNGRLLRYSPLSRVLELEGLLLFTVQRAALWRILETRALLDVRVRAPKVDLTSRAELAERQAAALQRALVREGGLSL
jgi:hypothetical protein